MKKIFSISAMLLGVVAFSQTTAPKPAPTTGPTATTTATTTQVADPGYKFDITTYDYGTIKKGGEPYCSFQLTNTGKNPLVISEAHGSCGCTVPEYPKEPIKPGETTTIRVHYDTNRPGAFDKTVTVNFTGISTPAVLHIHGVVESPPAETPFPAPGTGNANGGVPVNNN
ncbi:MAG TPA: DUF1573 domain-containing protein [Bacteroidia bacterium]|jgi:hypothetical protein|nr:DUF1573 domain-containing protein [Bacteroidia bacterium]